MDLRERIAASRMQPFQWLVIGLCVMLNMIDGYDVMALAFTAKSIGVELALSASQIGLLLSIGLVGMALGALVLAPLADKIGRRPLILISVALSTVGMALSATAGSALQLGAWRLITGLGVGGILACATVIASEYSSRHRRGLAISIYTSGYGIGATLGGLVAVFLQTEHGWRSVFVFGAILTGSALLVMTFLLPESVDFLYSRRPRAALARINHIAARLKHEPVDNLPLSTADTSTPAGRIVDLFGAGNARPTLLLWGAFFATLFGTFFVTSWTPTLLESAGLTKQQSATAGMMLTLGGTVGALAFGLAASRWQPRILLMVFTVLSAAAMALFILTTSLLPLAFALGIMVGGLSYGCIAGLYTLAPTLYTAQIRGTGVGWAIGIGRVGAILAPLSAGALLDVGWTASSLYLSVAGVVLLAAVSLAFLQPNPRRDHSTSTVEPGSSDARPVAH
ncbi:MAG: MFS transporter [Comamonadaceae bacterium]|jgi:benzoate transport|nr:MAG: MFS transporter [Comamonadaceae bacterium]